MNYINPGRILWMLPVLLLVTSAVKIQAQVSAPVFSPLPDEWSTIQNVAISASGASAIYYTTDGSVPTTSANLYSAPVLVARSLTLNAIGVSGSASSPVTSGTYFISGDISAGNAHVLGLTFQGIVNAWGSDNNGQLGNGTTEANQPTPVTVTGTTGSAFNDIVAVGAGALHSLFLRSDQTVWTCGDDTYGQLGYGGTADKHNPIQVIYAGSNLPVTGATGIGCGSNFCVAIVSPGGLAYAWGFNTTGECGTGSITATTYARANQVCINGTTGLSGVTQVACGGNFSAALTTGSAVYTWGDNSLGQMALPVATTLKSYATEVSGLSPIIAVGGGGNSVFAITGSNTVLAWGSNGGGQLGLGSTSNAVRTPQQVLSGTGGYMANVVQVASSLSHSLFLLGNGTVWASGSNAYGELGSGTTTAESSPVQVMISATSALSDIVAVSAGLQFSVALAADGTIYTWGNNTSGQLCNGGDTNSTGDYYATNASDLPQLTDIPPSVTLSGTETSLTRPSTITLAASASSAFESISSIVTYSGTTPIGGSTNSISSPHGGIYTFYATATDAAGLTGTSNTYNVTIAVPPPVITLTIPQGAVELP